MNITLLVPELGYSFINQAQALAAGLKELGQQASVVRVTQGFRYDERDLAAATTKQRDVVVAVGSWVHYRELIYAPKTVGFRIFPWLVSDNHVGGFRDELNAIPLIITTSRHCHSIFLRDGITTEICVVPEPVDGEFWKPLGPEDIRPVVDFLSMKEEGVLLPAEYDLGTSIHNGVPILFTIGGDATSKGALEVINALGNIYHHDPKLPWLYVLKTWPSAESMRRSADELALARTLGIADRIRYIVGQYSREFLRGLMNMCDIYVAPSRDEGFGLPHVEAAMCGKPAVGLSSNASGETIIDGKTGFVIKPDSTDNQIKANIPNLTEALTKLLTDHVLRKGMGESARVHAVKTYSPKIIALQFLDIFTAQKL